MLLYFYVICSVNDYIQSISKERGVVLDANEESTQHKSGATNCANDSPVLDCLASERTLPLPVSPRYLWPTYLGTASLMAVNAGTQQESFAYLNTVLERLTAAFKEGELIPHSLYPITYIDLSSPRLPGNYL